MVDAAASFARDHAAPLAHPVARAESVVTVHTERATAMAAYAAFERAVFSPSQSPAWVGSWATEIAADIVVATLHDGQRPLMALAIEIVRSGPFRIGRFAGGRHANGNFAPLAGPSEAVGAEDLASLAAAIHVARPDLDLLSLERLCDRLDGQQNPFLCLPHDPSPNLSLAVDLSGGFEGVLERSSGKRKRKKHRSQTRKFEAAGGFRLIEARTPHDVTRLLDAFFAMKRERFDKMGVADVFAPAGVKAFFRRLFTEALAKDPPPFSLEALEVNGELRAVTGSSRSEGRVICEFGAIREDELAGASPGDFLFFENIARASAEGCSVYDFSVGDEPYKRQWCDLEVRQFDVLVPLTMKGRLAAAGLRGLSRGKAALKNNRFAWRVYKTLRRGKGTAAPKPAAED